MESIWKETVMGITATATCSVKEKKKLIWGKR
jgi:hypothetical protein